jgi:hypothetical protein
MTEDILQAYLKAKRTQKILSIIIILLFIILGISGYYFACLERDKSDNCSNPDYDYSVGNLIFSMWVEPPLGIRAQIHQNSSVYLIFALKNIGKNPVRVLPLVETVSDRWEEHYKLGFPIVYKITNASSGKVISPIVPPIDPFFPITDQHLFILPSNDTAINGVAVCFGLHKCTYSFMMEPGEYILEAKYIALSNMSTEKGGWITRPYWTGELDGGKIKFTLVP